MNIKYSLLFASTAGFMTLSTPLAAMDSDDQADRRTAVAAAAGAGAGAAAAAGASHDEKGIVANAAAAAGSGRWLTGVPTEAEWASFERFIKEGIELTGQFEDFLPDYRLYSKFKEPFLKLCNLRRKLKTKEYQQFLDDFTDFTSLITCILETYNKKTGGAYEKTNHFRVGLRSQAQISFYTAYVDPHFQTFQKISNMTFDKLRIANGKASRGLIPCKNGKWFLGYYKDSTGFNPFVIKNTSEYESFNACAGKLVHGHQSAYLIKDGKFVEDSGLVIVCEKTKHLKVRGIYGEKGLHPFTSYRTTMRFPLNHPFVDGLKTLLGKDVETPERIHFVPIPETRRDWQVTELLFLEDLLTAKSRSDDKDGNEREALACIRGLESEMGRSIEEIVANLREELLQECERDILQGNNEAVYVDARTEFNDEKKGKGKKSGVKDPEPAATAAAAAAAPAPLLSKSAQKRLKLKAKKGKLAAVASPPQPPAALQPSAAPAGSPATAVASVALNSSGAGSPAAAVPLPQPPAAPQPAPANSTAMVVTSAALNSPGAATGAGAGAAASIPPTPSAAAANFPKKSGSSPQTAQAEKKMASNLNPLTSSQSQVRKKAEGLLEKLKVNARVKFRGVQTIVNKIKNLFPNAKNSPNVVGSHFIYHADQAGIASLVRPHGRQDRTIPAKRVNLFTERLIEQMMNQEGNQE